MIKRQHARLCCAQQPASFVQLPLSAPDRRSGVGMANDCQLTGDNQMIINAIGGDSRNRVRHND
jgi:hypothetical protein